MKRGGASKDRAIAGLVLLHGRGGSAADMVSMFDTLALPDVAVIAPEAPERSWWPVSFLAPFSELSAWLDRGLDAVAAAVAELRSDGLPLNAISICGFSQGACLGLEFAARQGQGLSTVFGFSGALVGTDDAMTGPQADLYGYRGKRFDYATELHGLNVELSCHERDPHIPLARFEESADVLRGLGATVARRVYPGAGHALMREDVMALRHRLNVQISAERS
ncbi:alpha/beta hydrolase [Roseivivax sediminis]|uniref:Phospholipase/carboxylesterase n=1 Tax=Roseivivax sediminis TaxID=936889 RepID=A0A1I1SW31_9RHOB|nr:dienelactone hydrolase family protein [Roseivivax sediminis]SFD50699.1 phospholipase/carboxylesterase [Roseivivax sediminis]